MVYSKQNEALIAEKRFFFGQERRGDMTSKIDSSDLLASTQKYPFLLQNQKALEEEFAQTFAVLQKQKDKNSEVFWLYCYYCATLLETFYKAYSQHGKESEYKQLKGQIQKRLEHSNKPNDSEESFIGSLKNSFVAGFSTLVTSPLHISQIRDYVAYANLCRVYWVFCRLTLTNAFSLLKNMQIIEKLDAVLGTHTDVDKIISVIQAPNNVLNFCSVGFFLIRFMIDAGLLLRHTFFPTEAEKKDKTTALERFKYEFNKRHCNFANDLVWATVNFLTNFNQISHIPGPISGAITAAFLGFDVLMTLYKCHLAKQEYLLKKKQYEQEIADLKNPDLCKRLTQEQKEIHKSMLENQLIELEISWRTKQAKFYFVAAAAALLMLGFTAALIFSPPGIILASFFACMLATAMYLSADKYSTFKEKSLRLESGPSTGVDFEVALKEYQAARNDFIFSMVKNTVVPAFLIATFAVCWPAAIAFTVLYIGYELYHAFSQHSSKKEAAKLALESPAQPALSCA